MADPRTYRPKPGEIPTDPGVYRFRDEHGRVIYVGKARNLRARLTPAGSRLAPALTRMIEDSRKRLAAAGKLLEAVSYKNILDRGFAIVTDSQDRIVKSAGQVRPGEELLIEVAEGKIGVSVGGAPRSTRKVKPPPGESNQGSLF